MSSLYDRDQQTMGTSKKKLFSLFLDEGGQNMLKESISMEEWMKTLYNTKIFGPTDLINLSPFLRYPHLKMTYHVKSSFPCKKMVSHVEHFTLMEHNCCGPL